MTVTISTTEVLIVSDLFDTLATDTVALALTVNGSEVYTKDVVLADIVTNGQYSVSSTDLGYTGDICDVFYCVELERTGVTNTTETGFGYKLDTCPIGKLSNVDTLKEIFINIDLMGALGECGECGCERAYYAWTQIQENLTGCGEC